MATPSTPDSAPKVVKIQRFQIGVNILLQLLILFGLVAMFNYMSFRHFKRWDLSRDKKFELSPQTRSLLGGLKKPVKAIVYFSSATEIAPDVSRLLREYEFASDKKFTTEVVDPYRNFTRAQDLSAKYRFGKNENILVLDIDGKSKFVNAADMADFEMPDQLEMMQGNTTPRLKAFKGEQAITSALLELVEGKPNKVYFMSGHGEPELNSADMKVFVEGMKRQNIAVDPVNLLNVNAIPEDARALVICGPKYDLSELETKLLTDFWNKNGRLYILLNPFAQTPRLASFIAAQGIIPEQDRVIRTGTKLQFDEQGKPQLVNAITTDPTFIIADSKTRITKDLAGLSKQFLGATQSLRIDKEQQSVAKTRLTPLIQSGEGFWGETDLANTEQQVFFDPKRDHMGPLNLAVAVEKGGVEDRRVKVDSSRMITVGNAEWLGVNAYRLSEGINSDFTISALNWLLDRDDELTGIPPKEKKKVTMTLSEKEMRSMALAVMGFLPGIVAILGVFNWWQRRS